MWLNITNEEFSRLLGVSHSQIRNYQKGRQSIPRLAIERASGGNKLLFDFLLGDPNIVLNDVDRTSLTYKDNSILQFFSTKELLAEIERRIEKD